VIESLPKAKIVCSETQVSQAIDKMADEITQTLKNLQPVMISTMLGGLYLTGELMRRLSFALQLDYAHATRYQGSEHGGALQWLVEPRADLNGRSVLLIDDVLDAGITLKALVDDCQRRGAARVFTAVLVDKQANRAVGGLQSADFFALTLPDYYLFGCGMDYNQYWRNLPAIYALEDHHHET